MLRFLDWQFRERPASSLDRVVRRGGGLAVVAGLSFVAGWFLPEFRAVDDSSNHAFERCLVVVEVVRLAFRPTETPGPVLLVQTARYPGTPALPASSADENRCDASERVLPVPPVAHVPFRRNGAVFVPSAHPGGRPSNRRSMPSGDRNHSVDPFPAFTDQEPT